MSRDSDPIMLSGKCPDDFTSIVLDLFGSIQYKLFGLMLIVFVIASSDVFINRILSRFKGAVDVKHPTSWGVFLQGMFITLSCIILDAAIHQKIL